MTFGYCPGNNWQCNPVKGCIAIIALFSKFSKFAGKATKAAGNVTKSANKNYFNFIKANTFLKPWFLRPKNCTKKCYPLYTYCHLI